MDHVIVETTSTATIAITVFGIVFSLMQTEYSYVRRSFAMFLGAVAVNNIPDAFVRMFDAMPELYSQKAEIILWQPSSLCLAPLFWIYVTAVTSTTQKRPAHLFRHLLLPALAAVVGLIMVVSQQDVWLSVASDDTLPTTAWPLFLISVFVLLQIALFPQMAVYLFLIVQRLLRYRLLLRDVYASTEEHELRWIYAIAGFAIVFWFARTFLLLFAFFPEQSGTSSGILIVTGLTALALIATTTLWGIRQRPPLVPPGKDQNPSTPAIDDSSTQPDDKYKKSALSAEAASRIAGKLRAAMETDRLYRDPNLSLWILARHIGASPNYISQTLNEVIGESFFDFVNRYRIKDAQIQLTTTDHTVLNITYDVGFNARSSFYNAFKRVTGQTPTSYRKTMSSPVGMDDTLQQSRNI